MLFPKTLGALLLLAGAHASHVVHERRDFLPSGWSKVSRANGDTRLPVHIALKPKNFELGHDRLMSVSDPSSADFGAHWTPQQVRDFFSPGSETVSDVKSWLAASGISPSRIHVPASRGFVRFDASVSEAESLFDTRYDVWQNEQTAELSITCDEYSIPQSLEDHIDFVTPTIGVGGRQTLANPKKRRQLSRAEHHRRRQTAADPPCWKQIGPRCIKDLYQVPEATSALKGNELGIYETMDTYDQPDLNLFYERYYPKIPNNTAPILQSIDGGDAPVPAGQEGAESILDLQVAYPLIYPQQIKLYQTLPRDLFTYYIFEPFLDALDAGYCESGNRTIPGYNGTVDCGVYKPAHVISFSYAIAEAYFTPAYARRQCHEFLKLGLMGTTMVFASGDNGTLSRAGVNGCLDGDAQNPSFLASCPYVTAVGATQIAPGADVTAPEVAVDPLNLPNMFPNETNVAKYSSGAGFSNYFPRPAYQEDAVSSYLTANADALPPSSTFNEGGRAFPDVSANGWNIVNILQGAMTLEAGTSASAPIFASIVNLLNEERIAAGKGPVGFVNPTLYAHPEMFNDIVSGYNLGCNSETAFNATEGWDPVTGLGTPNYPKMLEVFLGLP